jgi:hypothetical protein
VIGEVIGEMIERVAGDGRWAILGDGAICEVKEKRRRRVDGPEDVGEATGDHNLDGTGPARRPRRRSHDYGPEDVREAIGDHNVDGTGPAR